MFRVPSPHDSKPLLDIIQVQCLSKFFVNNLLSSSTAHCNSTLCVYVYIHTYLHIQNQLNNNNNNKTPKPTKQKPEESWKKEPFFVSCCLTNNSVIQFIF